MELSARTRREHWRSLREGVDVLVIGGGITGAGVVLDAVTRGLEVGLVEGRDFASGASSRSTKLIHGGIRYIPQLHLGLVQEGLHERQVLICIAPHLEHPLSFLVPIYDELGRPLGLAIPRPLRPMMPSRWPGSLDVRRAGGSGSPASPPVHLCGGSEEPCPDPLAPAPARGGDHGGGAGVDLRGGSRSRRHACTSSWPLAGPLRGWEHRTNQQTLPMTLLFL